MQHSKTVFWQKADDSKMVIIIIIIMFHSFSYVLIHVVTIMLVKLLLVEAVIKW